MMVKRAVLVILSLLLIAPVWAVTSPYEPPDPLPPVIQDTAKAADCTLAYLVTDVTMNEMLAVRMQITPMANDRPMNDVMPCPSEIPLRLATRALDLCIARAADPKNCVFADMGREFLARPTVNNTAEFSSRCASDKASDIGVACWRSGTLELCGVGCGDSPKTAIASAVSRCETRHQQSCPITGSLPVMAPR